MIFYQEKTLMSAKNYPLHDYIDFSENGSLPGPSCGCRILNLAPLCPRHLTSFPLSNLPSISWPNSGGKGKIAQRNTKMLKMLSTDTRTLWDALWRGKKRIKDDNLITVVKTYWNFKMLTFGLDWQNVTKGRPNIYIRCCLHKTALSDDVSPNGNFYQTSEEGNYKIDWSKFILILSAKLKSFNWKEQI